MRTLLLSSALYAILMSLPGQSAMAAAEKNQALEGLQGSRYSWMTDALDMQGGGTTLIEMLADKVIEKIEARWSMQKDALVAFKYAIQDPLFRSAADELIRKGPKDYLSAYSIIRTEMQNPITQIAFNNYGILNDAEELAFGLELKNYGYFQRVYNAATDANLATLKLWRNASSPLEEQIKYSAAYRYGID